MLTLINIEIYKIFKKLRTYISFGTIALLTILIQTAMLLEGKNYVKFATKSLQDTFTFVGHFLNGYLIGYIVLNTLTIHIPFLIALVAGDLLAGEATSGTYRLLISRPISRFSIITSKFIAGMVFTISLIFFMAVMSLGVGWVLFGTGELIVFHGGNLVILSSNDILWRFSIAYLFGILSMGVITALAYFFSSLVENAIGPIIATMAVVIIFLILSNLDIGFLAYIKPYLFTNYMGTWVTLFDSPVDYSEFFKAVIVLFIHVVGLFTITSIIFQKKDILT